MQPATVPTKLLPCAAIASRKVRSISYIDQSLEIYILSGHMLSECTNKKVFDFLANVPDMSEDEAWNNVVRTAKEATETRDLDDFRDVRRPFHFVSTFYANSITYQMFRRSKYTRRPSKS